MTTAEKTTSDPIPLVDQLSDIYSSERLVREGIRWEDLRSRFQQEFGSQPEYIARAPGRVNLMGDHVDHMKFSCLPAALELDILMAFRVESNSSSPSETTTFRLHNTNPQFKGLSFQTKVDNHEEVQLEHSGPSRWANYFKVAFKGLHSHLPTSAIESSKRPSRVDVMVAGTIPPESSLSSSAAMTTCSSIVILQAFQSREVISRREMAEVAIESERFVGVNSGGMDQAASIFGVAGSALHVSFVPQLSAVPIKLPPSQPPHLLVIANTLVTSDKKVMGPVQYNLRVGELRMACRALSKVLELPQDESTKVLKDLMETYFQRKPLRQGKEDKEVEEAWSDLGEEAAKIVKLKGIALSCIADHPLSREEVEQMTGYKGDDFEREFLTEFPIQAETFKLHRRLKHVFEESLRVLEFKAQCMKASSASLSTKDINAIYRRLGKIMLESKNSLFDNYENGCEELRKVCQIAEENGSLGSRPTGAGWGGSTVSLVEQRNAQKIVTALRKEYYETKFPGISDDDFNDAVLISQPAKGACIYKV
ncbi:hypothetical protein CBS101457_006589 [Exobasidium rhododendri]|nr:hypothetical protein CBS101457_006589 [Exobasidium rhododendri]